MPFVECLHAGAEGCSDELFRMIWYAVIHFTHHLEMTVSCQPLCGSIYISLGLPAVTLAKLNPNILDNTYTLNLLPLTLRHIIVAEWIMIWCFLRGDIDIVCIMHGVYQSTATTTTSTYYDLYQPLRLLTVILVDTSQLRSLESVVRCSVTVLYTLDMISRYFYAGLDRCSHIRHSRWMLLLFSDLSHSPDLIISQIRHIRRTLLLFMDYSAGFGLYPTRGVCGAASKPLTVRCYNSRQLAHCFLAYGLC